MNLKMTPEPVFVRGHWVKETEPKTKRSHLGIGFASLTVCTNGAIVSGAGQSTRTCNAQNRTIIEGGYPLRSRPAICCGSFARHCVQTLQPS